ncbi:MAG TPA: di-heme-cytochrome C peroxidase [Thermoanaerobaculia bacterium]
MKKGMFIMAVVVLSAAAAHGQTWLPQNWTPERRQQVYNTAQGSKLIPYTWALALERADDETLFFADNGRRFGFLPNGSATGLPVGVVEDRNLDGTSHLGLTCAACHTRDVHYQGTTYRIDGGGADSDLYLFLGEMSRATAATSRSIDSPKFRRFSTRVLGANAGASDRRALFNQLETFSNGFRTFITNSTPDTPWGRSRTDAFGMIFNRVTSIDLRIPSNSRKPNAPVSYPFLWDTSWLNKVQYDGGVPNESVVERLGRNVGEVLGVFAEVKTNRVPLLPPIMRSTAKRFNILALEDWWSELRSPKWADATVLPPIDASQLARGQQVYNQQCLSCHAMVTPGVRQNITLVALDKIGTDRAMTATAGTRMADTGILQGVRKNLIPFGPRFSKTALAAAITGHVTISVILTPEISPSNPSPNGPGQTSLMAGPAIAAAADAQTEESAPATNNDRDDRDRARVRALLGGTDGPRAAADAAAAGENELEVSLRAFGARAEAERATLDYRARPLDGIWATAPYLHNGSVPTLADLLKPAAQRPPTFYVGDCEIDPANVGCVATQRPGAFLFDTSKAGNRNTGHEYGTSLNADDRKALLEYLKSL